MIDPPVLSHEQIYERIAALPLERRARAVRAWQLAYGGHTSEDRGAKRDIDTRRAFYGDPWKYARDIFGYVLYPDLERALAACMDHRRILIPAATDLGKTFIISLFTTYRYDVEGAMPDVEAGLEQQGCLIGLVGPSEDSVFATTYLAMVKHFERAVRRGHGMPGSWSDKTIRMVAGPEWYVEGIFPAKKAGEEIAHGASGRHHRTNMVFVIEEGQAVREPVWAALDGGAVGERDTIISPFQPEVAVGPARERTESGEWFVMHMSAFDHPNVMQRRIVIRGAVSHSALERSIREQCKDIGPAESRTPDPKHNDFAYALPPADAKNETAPNPRVDGRGHALGVLRVYRPNGLFTAQRLGRWPVGSSSRLFTPEMIQESAARYALELDPSRPPDVVGLDPARYGDDAAATPRWGRDPAEILREYHEAALKGAESTEAFRANPKNRVRCGAPRIMPKGDGHALAAAALEEFPETSWVVDQGGGDSVIDQMRNAYQQAVIDVPFGGTPWDPVEGERLAVDMRAAMYIRIAELLTYGLLDSPMPPKLRKDLLAQRVEKLVYRQVDIRSSETGGWKRERRAHVRLLEKQQIKKETGRSPDYSDSLGLSICEPEGMGGNTAAAFIMLNAG